MMDPDNIDWLEEARLFYAARQQQADPVTLQVMAHHMEQTFNEAAAEREEEYDNG